MLARFGGSGQVWEACEGDLGISGEFDFTLATRVYSESLILNLQGVYTVTKPLFSQRMDSVSETHSGATQKWHSSFTNQSRNQILKNFERVHDKTENTSTGVALPSPPVPTEDLDRSKVFAWVSHGTILEAGQAPVPSLRISRTHVASCSYTRLIRPSAALHGYMRNSARKNTSEMTMHRPATRQAQ